MLGHIEVGPEIPSSKVSCNSPARRSAAHNSSQVAHKLSVGNPA